MRSKLIARGGRPPPAPVNLLTLLAQPQTTGIVGQEATLFGVVAQNAVGTPNYFAQGLPTGLTQNSASGIVSGTYTEAGTFNVTLSVTDDVGQDDYEYVCVVAASSVGIVVAAGQILPFGSTTLTGQAGIQPEITGGELANAIINTEDGGTPTHFDVDTKGFFTAKAGAVLTPGANYVQSCTFTGIDASVVNVDVTIAIEVVPGRSVGILTEFNSAIAAIPAAGGVNVYCRGGASYGNVTVSRNLASPSYITKHTGQTELPKFHLVTLKNCKNVNYSYLDVHKTSAVTGRVVTLDGANDLCGILNCKIHAFHYDPNGTYTDSSQYANPSGILGIGAQSKNLTIRGCEFYDLGKAMSFGTGGFCDIENNWQHNCSEDFLTYGWGPSNIAGGYTRLRFRMNIGYDWIGSSSDGGAGQGPHVDFCQILPHSNDTMPGFEFTQNVCFKGSARGAPHGLFFNNGALITSLLGIIVCGNFFASNQQNACTLSNLINPIVCGNSFVEWNITTGNAIPTMALTGSGDAIIRGNISGRITYGSGYTSIDKGPGGTDTNIELGYRGTDTVPDGYTVNFVGPIDGTATTFEEVLARYSPKPGSPAALKKAGAFNTGYQTPPTNFMDSAGSSIADLNGDFWG